MRDNIDSLLWAKLALLWEDADHDIHVHLTSFFRGYPWFLTYFLYSVGILYQKMSLTQAQIAHLAKLTSLTPQSDLEISSVVDSFTSLSSTDTSHVDTISRSGKTSLTLREDIVDNSELADQLLACSNQKKAAHQIVLGGIMIGE